MIQTAGWWERFPGRLEKEQSALSEAGINHDLITPLQDRNDQVSMRLTVEIEGREIRLRVVYPDSFPYFRPFVFWDDERLDRHQHPFNRNLCLLPAGTHHWRPSDTLGAILRPQIEQILRVNQEPGSEEAARLEARQGEPYSHYYTYDRPSVLLIDGEWSLPLEHTRGRLVLRYQPHAWLEHQDGGHVPVIRAVVAEVQGEEGQSLAVAHERLLRPYGETAMGRWIRSDVPVPHDDPEAFAGWIVDQSPELAQPPSRPLEMVRQKSGRGRQVARFDVCAVVFPEEVSWRKTGDGWSAVARPVSGKGTYRLQSDEDPHLVRFYRSGPKDLRARIPELASNSSKTVAVVGTGGLGGPATLELAKAGVGQLRLLDGDVFDPATSIRWIAGPDLAGHAKVVVASDIAQRLVPFTNVTQLHQRRLGAIRHGSGPNLPSEGKLLAQFLDGVDLVLDASAELAVQHYLSTEARLRGIPYICCSATAGGWGGVVVRVPVDRDQGCWACAMAHLGDMGVPPGDPEGLVEPAGCGDPTFTGASFDLMPLVAATARVATSQLADGDGKYPGLTWDIARLSLRSASGEAIPPEWQVRELTRHEKCTAPGLH